MHPRWYWPEDQELVHALPQTFRQLLIETSLAILNDPEHASDAAHTLGYLKCEQALDPLFTYLVSVDYCDLVALVALLHLQTKESFHAVEIAMSEIGKRLGFKEQQGTPPRDDQETVLTRRDLYYTTLDEIRIRGVQQCSPEKIIPFLTRLLPHPNEYVRHIAVRGLGQLGVSETIPAIIQSKQSETENPSMGILETLLEFGTQIDVEPLIALADDPSTPDHVLRHVIRALGISRDRRAIGVFKRFIKKSPVILALRDWSLPEAIPLLVQVLESKRINLRNCSLKNRDDLDYTIIDMLGKLGYPSAFETIENFAKEKLPAVGITTISALAATGGEKAIPFLHKAWDLDIENKRIILQALLWIGTNASVDKIKELLAPYDREKANLLAKALCMGKNLPLSGKWTRSSSAYDWVDDQLIEILDRYVDEMSKDNKLTVISALGYIAMPSVQRLLGRIASDPHYDIPCSSNSPPTLREVAVQILCEQGSEVAIDFVLDKLPNQSLSYLEFWLAKLAREPVRDALLQRLGSATDAVLSKILKLLGIFGDHTVLPMLITYISNPKIEIADAAYTAEQQILGMA